MSLATEAPGPRPPSAPVLGRAIVPLLALAVFINYVDRGNLATAAPLIKGELHLTAGQVGLLISAFFWTYVPAQILAAWLAERISAYRVLALGVALWSLATAATGLAGGFAALLALRLLLGMGEAAAFPCSSNLIGAHLPPHKLGAANGLIAVGLSLGPAVGTFVGGLVMARFGWRPAFLIFGLVSLLWLVPWLASTHRLAGKARQAAHAEPVPSFLAILRRREAIGACLGHFCHNYGLYFVLSWLPLYLVQTRGLSVARMAEIGGLIYLVQAAGAFAVGWLCDRLTAAGVSFNLIRKLAMGASALLLAAALLVAAVGDAQASIAALFACGLAFSLATPNVYAVGQTLAGPRAAGKWIGLQNCLANTAGILAPLITGFVVDRTGQFFWAFVIAAGVSVVGALAYVLVVRRIAPLDWSADLRRTAS